MRADEQHSIAALVREYRDYLKEALTELAERGEPTSALEARLIIEASAARCAYIESFLRDAENERDSVRRRLRRLASRLLSRTRPRIGVLYHYEPRPLTVPSSYMRVSPPNSAPKISIVTPTFQQGEFLERTLYSVLAQRYPELQYVVQDGASTDNTLEVLRRFDPLLTRWVSEPDDGQADAINRGFRQTDGEIMAWLNSDDLLLPGALAYVARYFADHPEVDVVYGHRVMIDEHDGQIGVWIVPAHHDRALTFGDYIPQETLFWRRRIWDAAGGAVDTSFGYALDWDLLLRFRAAGAIMVRVPRFIGAFRVHAAQKTTAEQPLGQAECDRLRERVHGRPLSIEEVHRGLKPYLRRHVLVHSRERAFDRLRRRRDPVRIGPSEPLFGKLGSEHAKGEESLNGEGTALAAPARPARLR